jgi:hypothetical protein
MNPQKAAWLSQDESAFQFSAAVEAGEGTGFQEGSMRAHGGTYPEFRSF